RLCLGELYALLGSCLLDRAARGNPRDAGQDRDRTRPRHIVTHGRVLTPLSQRITLAEHRPPRGAGVKRSDPHPEELALVEAAPEIAPYISALKQKGRKAVALALRQ